MTAFRGKAVSPIRFTTKVQSARRFATRKRTPIKFGQVTSPSIRFNTRMEIQ